VAQLSSRPAVRESRVIRKITVRLVPFLGLLYLINYLDRVNVSFAALTMNADLGFMFFIEGVPAVLLGVLVAVLLPSRPRHATWLTDQESSALEARIAAEDAREVGGEVLTRAALTNPRVMALSVAVCAIGVYAAIPVFWQLPNTFLTGVGAAAGIGMINSFGNLSGFLGPYLAGWLQDMTGSFRPGLWVVAGFMVLAGILALPLRTIDTHSAPATAAQESA
jgi:MFS transporter, ACS family, tartrate transporter